MGRHIAAVCKGYTYMQTIFFLDLSYTKSDVWQHKWKLYFQMWKKKGTKQRERERGGMMLFLLYMCNALRKALTGLLSPIKSYKHLSRDNSEPNRLRVPQHADISSKKKLFLKKNKKKQQFISILFYLEFQSIITWVLRFFSLFFLNFLTWDRAIIFHAKKTHHSFQVATQ